MRSLSMTAGLESLGEVLAFLTGAVPEEYALATSKVELILEEFLVNVVKHAYRGEPGPLEVRLGQVVLDGWPHLAIKVVDWGPPFDPLNEAPAPDLSLALEDKPIGGLGLHLVKSLADHHSYRRELGANTVEAWVRRP